MTTDFRRVQGIEQELRRQSQADQGGHQGKHHGAIPNAFPRRAKPKESFASLARKFHSLAVAMIVYPRSIAVAARIVGFAG
jgi:hypothetical protein